MQGRETWNHVGTVYFSYAGRIQEHFWYPRRNLQGPFCAPKLGEQINRPFLYLWKSGRVRSSKIPKEGFGDLGFPVEGTNQKQSQFGVGLLTSFVILLQGSKVFLAQEMSAPLEADEPYLEDLLT